ncbi:MAG: serine/threonine protein kinase [Polyangiaceae bacterium]|nr:serine/threonine protein kinase [Polyangiaceae bacterium]
MKVITRRFEVEEKIGSGGMSTVFRARDRESRRNVALKVLRRGGMADVDRFDREARVLADLTHPGIVRYVTHGETDEGDPFLAMEWLDGVDLAELLRRRTKLLPSDAIRLGVQVAEALAEAHAHGIVHRDIKPSNIFLEGGDIGRVKLLDFGMARWSQVARMATITGTVLGTPAYMAPEQARGDKKVGPQADVFALGCVLFECLTGKPAFAGDHMLATLSKLLLEEPPSIRRENKDVPANLAALVERMMERDPSRRPANGAEAAACLSGLVLGAGEGLSLRSEAVTLRSATGSGRRSMTPSIAARSPVLEEGSRVPSRRLRRPSSKETVAIRPSEAPPAPVLASSQASLTPPSRKKRKPSPSPRRAMEIGALNRLMRTPGSVGPISEAVLAVLGRHIPMPWAMLKAQCDRIGINAADIAPGELPVLADILLTAASRFVGRAERTEMLREMLALYLKG